MPQSNVIFFYIFAAYLIFITMRGELPKYLGFLLASPANANQNVNTPGGTDKLGQVTGGQVLSVVQSAAMFLPA